jgi:hypothetical protein
LAGVHNAAEVRVLGGEGGDVGVEGHMQMWENLIILSFFV